MTLFGAKTAPLIYFANFENKICKTLISYIMKPNSFLIFIYPYEKIVFYKKILYARSLV